MANEKYALLISFEDQSPSFVHGFEAGGIYERMKAKQPIISCPIHSVNVDLVSQMAAREAYTCRFTETAFEEWTNLRAEAFPNEAAQGDGK